MKIVKISFSIILSFILMLGIFASTILYIANTYTEKEYLLAKFDEIDLYTQVYEEVKEGFENYIYQSGLDISIIDKICDKDKVKQDILLVVDAIYSGNNVEIDTSSIRLNLDNAINEYISSQNRKLSNQEKENITKFEDIIVDSYKEELSIYTKIQSKLSGNIKMPLELLKKCTIGTVIITLIIMIIVLLINRKNIYSGLSYIGISIISSGIILKLIENLINTKINIEELIIISKAISNTIIYIIKEILYSIETFGICYICIGIVVIILTSIKNKI